MRTTALRAAVPLAALLAIAGCAPRASQTIKIDPALATLIPPDAVVLVGVKADALRTGEFYRRWITARPQPQLDEFAKRTGLDPRRDIWELLVASDGKSAVAMARGKFSPTGLEPTLAQAGAQRFAYKGYTLVGSEQAAVVFMNASTALAGPAAALRATLDRREAGSAPPKALLDRVANIPATSQVWVAAMGPFDKFNLPVSRTGSLSIPPQMFGSIHAVTAWADLRTGVDFAATIEGATPADAKRVHDALKGLIGMGRLSTPDGKGELLRLYDSVGVEQKEREVLVKANIPMDLIEKLPHW
jgi:hypothetical protein